MVIIRYVYRGEEGEHIPDEATHIIVGEDVTFVRARAFVRHPNIVEIICHEGVEKIGASAFWGCPNLRRVIMPGVKILGANAFFYCEALEDVECDKLEIIGLAAFGMCESLSSINLPSAIIVGVIAFNHCKALFDVTFGNTLVRFEEKAFLGCEALERITIPLKDNFLITANDTFQACKSLKQVDLVEGVELHETVAALQLEEWRNDMNREIDSINQILPDTHAGASIHDDEGNEGGKAQAIRRWIRSVLFKISYYKAEHQKVLEEAATAIPFALPRDIMMKNVLSFLELPPYTFGYDNHEQHQCLRRIAFLYFQSLYE